MSTFQPLKALVAGAAGACLMTALHQSMRNVVPHAPRLDLLGMRSIAKSLRALHQEVPARGNLQRSAMAGDLAANAVYFSLSAAAGRENALWTGAALGAAAGVGALLLPEPMGIGSAPSARTPETAAMTIGLYMAGAMASAAIYRSLAR